MGFIDHLITGGPTLYSIIALYDSSLVKYMKLTFLCCISPKTYVLWRRLKPSKMDFLGFVENAVPQL